MQVIRVKYGSHILEARLIFRNRKTLSISVLPDCSIEVIAPEAADMAQIEAMMLKRGRWILKQKAYFEQFLPRTPERQYVAGETHLYFRKTISLKVI